MGAGKVEFRSSDAREDGEHIGADIMYISIMKVDSTLGMEHFVKSINT